MNRGPCGNRRTSLPTVLMLASAGALLASVTHVRATVPSFDCGKAHDSVEKLICQDDALAALDRSLSAAYKKALVASSAQTISALRDAQRRWLQERRICGQRTDVRGCVEGAYNRRLTEIASPSPHTLPDRPHSAFPHSVAEAPKGDSQVVPTRDLLYNTAEAHSINYTCEPDKNGQLNCDFVQTSVRQKGKLEELPSALEQLRKGFESDEPFSTEQCKEMQNAILILDGKTEAPDQDAFKVMSPIARKDFLGLMQALARLCEIKSEDNLIALAKLYNDREQRTCLVSSYSFSQSFRLVGAPGTWVSQGNPSGPCGIIHVTRFEPEEVSIGESRFNFWRYIARKVITIPDGKFGPGLKCGAFDERPVTYDWRSKEHQISCDYIEFSP